MTTPGDLPFVSVIIPTHNRSASLRRTLQALCRQTYPHALCEVIVVPDGCSDDTVDMLQAYAAPFTLRVIVLEGPNQGPAAARNRGAASATGALLLFLDDDVEPQPPVLMAHVRAHARQSDLVVIGPYVPVVQGRVSYLRRFMRTWWQDKFHTMRQPGYRFGYSDLLSGNVSLQPELFARVGGFDPTLPCAHEDYELGVRLLKAGASFTLAPEALAAHHEHEHTDLNRTLQRQRLEGVADVHIGRRHPELIPTLLLGRLQEPRGGMQRLVNALACEHPRLGDRLAALCQWLFGPLEKMHCHSMWHWAYTGLGHYWYLRGVAEAAGSRQAVAKLLQAGQRRSDPTGLEIEVDLAEGLEAAEGRLDRERPYGACLYYRQRVVGYIPPQAGAERLRGAHLRPILATKLAWPLLVALALEGTLDRSQPFTQGPLLLHERS
jgi:GT2 family glycosyltransferase